AKFDVEVDVLEGTGGFEISGAGTHLHDTAVDDIPSAGIGPCGQVRAVEQDDGILRRRHAQAAGLELCDLHGKSNTSAGSSAGDASAANSAFVSIVREGNGISLALGLDIGKDGGGHVQLRAETDSVPVVSKRHDLCSDVRIDFLLRGPTPD